MKVAVLFDGAGGSRLGLEQAGHKCTGFELDEWKHYLSQYVGTGNCVLQDATTVDLKDYDAIWASPPCQFRSGGRRITAITDKINYLDWCIQLVKDFPDKVIWIENVIAEKSRGGNNWGTLYNAGQFLETPIQNRNRIIGGKYSPPNTFHGYKKRFPDICPCITATEYKGYGGKHDNARAARFYKRKLTLEECAYHQGFDIPKEWYTKPENFNESPGKWKNILYEAIGNMVPPYMSLAFGNMYDN